MPKSHPSPTRSASPSPPAESPPPRRRELFALIGAGAFLLLLFGDMRRFSVDQVLPFVIAAGLLLVTPLTRRLTNVLERIRRPSRRGVFIGAAAVTLVSFAVLAGVPLLRGYELIPRSHDEHMHLLQMQMLARGRLWMAAHPMADFFETFFVLTRPVYASIYFPGTSLLLVPTVWLALPYWVMPAAYSAIAVGLLYLVLSEAVDGVAGALGAMLLLGSSMFREVALLPMSHNVMLMLALAATYFWLRWRATGTGATRWALLAGAAGGLAAITRPLDALCFVAPLSVASLPTLLRMPACARLNTIGVAVAAALPFLALQLVLNAGATGMIFSSPYQLYLDTQQPGTSYGFSRPDPDAAPQSRLLQKHLYYDEFHRPAIARHQPAMMWPTFLHERLPLLLMTTVAHPLLLLVLPLGVLGLRALGSPERAVAAGAMLAALPMLAVGYAFNALLLSHYLVVWMPPMILLIVLAPLALARAFPRMAAIMPVAATLTLVAAIVSAQPGVNPHAQSQWTAPQMSDVHQKLAALPHKPAVVLFHFDPETNVHHEPVYNVETAWPDDAEVIRAHDLGDRDVEIVRYYAQREPARHFYLYDRSSRELTELGPAKELLERMTKMTTTAPTTTITTP